MNSMMTSPAVFSPATNRPMRVLFGHCLASRSHPAARMVRRLADELALLGPLVAVHEPELVAGAAQGRPGAGSKSGGRVAQAVRDRLWFAKTMWRDRTAIATDIQAIELFRPDVVVARHDAYRGSLVQAAARLRVPVVLYADAPVAHETRHWSDGHSPAGRRFHPPLLVEHCEKELLRLASAAVAVSDTGRDCLERYNSGCPVRVIRNGVGAEFCGPALTPAQQKRLREELGLTTPLVAGFVGTFKPFHGTGMLSAVIRAMRQRDDLGWLLVGDGPCKAEFMASLGGAAGRVVDLGTQPAARLPLLYRLMDMAVAPYPASRHAFHFSPLKIMEAQASSVAVVASARGDIPAMLGHGHRGALVYEESVEAWVAMMDSLLNDAGWRLAMGQAAQAAVRKNATWASSAQGLHELLVGLCGGIHEMCVAQ